MWIKTPENLQSLKPPELDSAVDLSGGEKVQVKKDVGELLVEKYEDITESKS